MNSTRKRVVVITDCKDVAFNEVKLIIAKECEKLGVFDVDVDLVAVEEFSIINAAFLTRLIAEQCPPGTVLSIIINPLKYRSARIFGRLKNDVIFFGANTGALTWLVQDIGLIGLYEVKDPGFLSFGGKYVHAPSVAKLVSGIPFDELGVPFFEEDLTDLSLKDGTVVHIDNFGLMKIKGETPVYEDGQKLKIFKNGEYIIDAVFANRMMSLEDDEWAVYAGSSLDHFPELGKVRNKNGYLDIKARVGDIITWELV